MAISPLQDSLFSLNRVGVRPVVAGALAASLEETAEELETVIRNDIPAFTNSGNPDVLPELRVHLQDQLTEIHRLLGGARTEHLEFVRRHATRQAEQRFPLEATLHAYRVALKVIGHWLRTATLASLGSSRNVNDALAAATDFTIDYIDSVSTIATSEYVRRTRQLSEAEADRRSQLLSLLLEGYDESDGRIAKLLRSAGYLDQRQSFCVIVASSVDAREMQNTARANRLLAAIRKALEEMPVRALFGFHEYRVVAIVSATRRLSGWTTPQAALASRVGWPMLTLGNSVLVGVSADAPSTALIPKALREAELALDVADAGQRVVEYSKIPLRTLLLHLAEGNVQSAMPAWASALRTADRKCRGTLVATLRAYADADMNVLKSAQHLDVHPNTIYARMQRIRDVTALDPLRYHALNEMLLAVDCMRLDA
jgi:hypothetical protein